MFEHNTAGRTPIVGAVVELTNSEMRFPKRSLQTDTEGTAQLSDQLAGRNYVFRDSATIRGMLSIWNIAVDFQIEFSFTMAKPRFK